MKPNIVCMFLVMYLLNDVTATDQSTSMAWTLWQTYTKTSFYEILHQMEPNFVCMVLQFFVLKLTEFIIVQLYQSLILTF